MTTQNERYIPALGYHWLTSLYDPVVQLTTRESTFKPALIAQANLQAGERVLDLACGTATLTLLAKRAQPAAEVHGVDGDSNILKIAADKAQREGLTIQLQQGLANALPYADSHFDRAMSSLFFHHLTRETKRAAFAELHRVLKPNGELHVADWGQAHNSLMRVAFFGIQLLDGFVTTADNVRGLLPTLMLEAGFVDVCETERYSTVFGTMSLYRARKSA
ncbi:class I SAM-dependent methyltransferase [Stenotrophobium rhamnosiphilum]|uniref:Methyltransferase type 11 n=1 Tax=Stenotrophobium rhamnosiphilum TaxID=2029166 RepID=A0A2T5MCS0_9GAMM|nr:class I SAM-dependent methyltransferase [Stenotrophobium rhamnosiphilum]PTU30379.1 methyltransferase type 11 [Stenotrophobium rhamnosiphilum]